MTSYKSVILKNFQNLSFKKLELAKHSKVKRQSSTPNAPELEQQPDIAITDWKNKPTHDNSSKTERL